MSLFFIKQILKRGIARSMFYEFLNFDRSTKWLSVEALPVYNPLTDEWQNSFLHICHVHYCQPGMSKIHHFCLVLHFPDYWWGSSFHAMVICISHYPSMFCETCLFPYWFVYVLHIFSVIIFHLLKFLPVCTCILILLLMSYNLFILVLYCFWILCDA